MAKYQVVHSCGHSETVDISGPQKDRNRKAEWMSEQLCPECRPVRLILMVRMLKGDVEFALEGQTFRVKDALKSRGYQWDMTRSAWVKVMPYDQATLTNEKSELANLGDVEVRRGTDER